MRLFKGISSDVLAGSAYLEMGLDPYPDTGVEREFPLRHVVLRGSAPSTYIFNGSMDAREYPLPPEMVKELLSDLSAAHPSPTVYT
ncbi:hypothetical protein KW794_00465 [Candidatus Saccharibacteria bacterium]|nr:hypothetical protein [Candidatus Saccharibacteria bacterium]